MKDVRSVVNSVSEGELKAEYLRKLKNELYPDAFANEHSWLHVMKALELHDAYVKEYVIRALEALS